ncbi:S46 family peptidase [Ferrimonas sp. SCSIO 43195]|uniref:S46 family peptidase n=1 Tax=Ferrimonas sp. SCSIO 43195 TaxID=2822844 RepID=UPI0020758228|nr:S46 family peptidase [Ferrimonas sp. SCSIO 43195]USD37080.1 S46 family peptidase [Ferrimonas sp. SCSIO 43195]
MPTKVSSSVSVLALSLAVALPAVANEGQWLPMQMPQLSDELQQAGIRLPAEQLADLNQYPMNAVVGLGYCTASFVSPKGLVVTNHHCAYRGIQFNSNEEHNYLDDGFLATSLDKEPSAGPQERLYVTDKIEDVTEQVYAGVNDDMDGYQRYHTIQGNRKALLKQCESNDNYRCHVRSFHGGKKYYLLRQLMIRDVRLVYAPPQSVGSFGGDIDNFEYPRHSGDFTFLRAYVAPDGSPAAYSEDNVPYQPKSFLKVNASGVKQGDGVLVAGYPGRTSRHKLLSELEFASNWQYPVGASRYQQRIDLIDQYGLEDGVIKIAYAGTKASLANRMKKMNGLLDGFRKTDIPAIKGSNEHAFKDWLKAEPSRADALAKVEQLEKKLAEQRNYKQRAFYFENAQSSALLNTANRLYKLANERQKPDAEREEGYQERDMKMLEGRLNRLTRSFHTRMDRGLWQMDIDAYLAQSHRTAALDKVLETLDLDQAYANTGLNDSGQRLKWMTQPVSAFKASDDPFIKMAVALYDANEANRKQRQTLAGDITAVRPAMMAALLDWYDSRNQPVYPDANGTLRISYGVVDGYQAADALYKQPFTRLEGIVEKHTGVEPFNAPQKILEAIKAKRYGSYSVDSIKAQTQSWYCGILPCAEANDGHFGSVPVNFLSSVDTTGGNSGSPILNGDGDLVGLNFDSTYESITKDWYFNPSITRAVHVDFRYVLWMMENVDSADNLLTELTLIK